jgi:2-dehydropantoate 2-reductase
MKIAILGGGAVGLGLGATLHAAGCAPRIVVRNAATRAALQARGLHRFGFFDPVAIAPEQLELLSDPAALANDPPDIALVCTKTTANPELSRVLEDAFGGTPPPTKWVFCQNGWGSERAFAGWLPEAQLFHARVITGFRRARENEIEITAHAQPIAVGSLFREPASALGSLCDRIAAGGLPCAFTRGIGAELWGKMLYNCALNPLGALLEVAYGELIQRPPSKALVESVVVEIFAVLAAAEFEAPWPDAGTYLEVFYRELLPPTERHRSSMLQDLAAGRRTEIDALCGEVVALGEQVGVATPVNAALVTLVRAREARGPSSAATRLSAP